MKNNLAKQTLKLYLDKGLNLYETLGKIKYEISRINNLLRNKTFFEEQIDYIEYKKYATERKKTLRQIIPIINKELGYKNKGQRDKILNKHLNKLKKIRKITPKSGGAK